MALPSANSQSFDRKSQPQNVLDSQEVLSEEAFRRMISQERKRSERSQRPFALLLIEAGHSQPDDRQGHVLLDMLAALRGATRETDVTGWYTTNSVMGVVFTEIVLENSAVLSTILSRIGAVLRGRLDTDQFSQIKFSFHVFPQDGDSRDPERHSYPTLYPDLKKRQESNHLGRATKRLVDVLGSLSLLAILSPVFFVIAAAIKLNSPGPVLFRQKRIGAGSFGSAIFGDRDRNQDLFPGACALSSKTDGTIRRAFCLSEIPVDAQGQRCQRARGICSSVDCRAGGKEVCQR